MRDLGDGFPPCEACELDSGFVFIERHYRPQYPKVLWGDCPARCREKRLAESLSQLDIALMKRSNTKPSEAAAHLSREDRALTPGGKTKNSKVRSEGRSLAAQERASEAKARFLAEESKGVV